MTFIPTGVGLTSYSGGPADFMRTPLKHLGEQIAAGTFRLQDIVEAHRCMDVNRAGGKL